MRKSHKLTFILSPIIVLFLMGATNSNSNIIADSVRDFSGKQGLNNWSYGYWDQSKDIDKNYDQTRDFSFFQNFGKDPVNKLSNHTEFTTGDLWYLKDGQYYTSLWAEGGHPHADMYLGAYERADQWVIRRWISTLNGAIEIQGKAGKVMPWGENWSGTVAFQIVSDGNTVYHSEVDDGGKEYSIKTRVKVGTPVDFLIGPGSAIGVVKFTSQITSAEQL